MVWLAEGDVSKLKAVGEMPVIDFFIMLNKKNADAEKQIEQARIQANKGRY